MHWKLGFAWTALVCGLWLGGVERARAQGGYSGKVVYGMFGPRVLGGETLQSPVQRAERGISRDAYGNFLGVNRTYSGRRFPEPGHRPVAHPPAPLPPQPEVAPETPSAPEEWLRTEGEEATSLPGPWTSDEEPSGNTSREAEDAGARRSSGVRIAVVGSGANPRSVDPFAVRIAAMLEKMPQIAKRSPIRVTLAGETAILRGRVATARDRELAENVVLLEPGIRDVRNELVVEQASRVAAVRAAAPGRRSAND